MPLFERGFNIHILTYGCIYVAIHNGADKVISICIDSQYQQREALIRVCAEILGGLTRAG